MKFIVKVKPKMKCCNAKSNQSPSPSEPQTSLMAPTYLFLYLVIMHLKVFCKM